MRFNESLWVLHRFILDIQLGVDFFWNTHNIWYIGFSDDNIFLIFVVTMLLWLPYGTASTRDMYFTFGQMGKEEEYTCVISKTLPKKLCKNVPPTSWRRYLVYYTFLMSDNKDIQNKINKALGLWKKEKIFLTFFINMQISFVQVTEIEI